MIPIGMNKMVEIYMKGNFCLQTAMTFESVLSILEDDFIKPDMFVRVKLPEGCMSAFRKGDVVGLSEITEFIEV